MHHHIPFRTLLDIISVQTAENADAVAAADWASIDRHMADLRLECSVRHHDTTSTAPVLNDGDVMDDRVPSFNQRRADNRHRPAGEPRNNVKRSRSTKSTNSEREDVGGQDEHKHESLSAAAKRHFPDRELTEGEFRRDSARQRWSDTD